jgi:hypothetical protein
MTVGIAASAANSALDTLMNSTYIELHTGDPGASGTANVFSSYTGGGSARPAATYSSASAGSKAITTTLPAFAITGSGTISHISYWTATSAGTFKGSVTLSASKAVANGDTLTVNTLTSSITPIAA